MSETPGKYKTRNKEPSFGDIVARLAVDVKLLKQNTNPTFADVFEIITRITKNCEQIASNLIPYLGPNQADKS